MMRPKIAAALIGVLASAAFTSVQAGEEKETNEFLALSEAQRYWWFEGAFRTAGHLLGMRDQKQAECALNWYLNDRDGKRKLLERTIAREGNHSETTVVLSAIQQACGPLVPKPTR